MLCKAKRLKCVIYEGISMNSNMDRKYGIRKLIHIWSNKDFNEETQTTTYTMCKKGNFGNDHW